MSVDVAELESQIDSLRRKLNIMAGAAAIGVLFSSCLAFVAFARPTPNAFDPEHAGKIVADLVVVRNVGIVNDSGQTVAEILTDDGGNPSLMMQGTHGNVIDLGFSGGTATAKTDNPRIRLGLSATNAMATLRAGQSGSGLSLGDGKGNSLVILDAAEEGNSSISFRVDEQNKGHAQIGISPSGIPEVSLRDRTGKTVFEQHGEYGTPVGSADAPE